MRTEFNEANYYHNSEGQDRTGLDWIGQDTIVYATYYTSLREDSEDLRAARSAEPLQILPSISVNKRK